MRLENHTAASSRSFAGPEACLQKSHSWTVSLIFSAPVFSCYFIECFMCLDFSNGSDDIFVVVVFKNKTVAI